jgi:magnesium-transporting ATPase (P-type)
MYDPNYQPSPPPQPVQPYQPIPPYQPIQPPKQGGSWPPFMGMLSILTVVFPFIFLCIFCLIFYSIGSKVDFNTELMTETDFMNMGLGTIGLLCATFIVSIVGIVIGLAALFGKTANKVLGLIGLGLNAFMLLAMMCGFLILILA